MGDLDSGKRNPTSVRSGQEKLALSRVVQLSSPPVTWELGPRKTLNHLQGLNT
jgi:hypothetical protein